MDRCYLCDAPSAIQETSEGQFIKCSGSCGPYFIGLMARRGLPGSHGRKENILSGVLSYRKKYQDRPIRIYIDEAGRYSIDCAPANWKTD